MQRGAEQEWQCLSKELEMLLQEECGDGGKRGLRDGERREDLCVRQ